MIPKIDDELWMLERLREKGCRIDAFDGLSDIPERAERVRQAIIARNLEMVIAGRRGADRRPLTFAEVYQWLYAQPLHHPTGSKGK